ncbi:hypothetical protein A6301_16395 [Pectobacterium sp. IFB5596]|nr:hypothetical protein [Pectobacterium sp. IFB5596]
MYDLINRQTSPIRLSDADHSTDSTNRTTSDAEKIHKTHDKNYACRLTTRAALVWPRQLCRQNTLLCLFICGTLK